jgi:hypothetical protein
MEVGLRVTWRLDRGQMDQLQLPWMMLSIKLGRRWRREVFGN